MVGILMQAVTKLEGRIRGCMAVPVKEVL